MTYTIGSCDSQTIKGREPLKHFGVRAGLHLFCRYFVFCRVCWLAKFPLFAVAPREVHLKALESVVRVSEMGTVNAPCDQVKRNYLRLIPATEQSMRRKAFNSWGIRFGSSVSRTLASRTTRRTTFPCPQERLHGLGSNPVGQDGKFDSLTRFNDGLHLVHIRHHREHRSGRRREIGTFICRAGCDQTGVRIINGCGRNDKQQTTVGTELIT